MHRPDMREGLDMEQRYRAWVGDESLTEWTRFTHDQGMVATVFGIHRHHRPAWVLKIAASPYDALTEAYFLSYWAGRIPVPQVLACRAGDHHDAGAVLMEWLPGTWLTVDKINADIAFSAGQALAMMHAERTDGFGYVTRGTPLMSDPVCLLKAKFDEVITECCAHFSARMMDAIQAYWDRWSLAINGTDEPCMVHRDFRPGNVIVDRHGLRGIIDWSSARCGLALEDWSAIEHGEWGTFNGHAQDFIRGYTTVRPLPKNRTIMPLLRLIRAMNIIGFTLKKGTWNHVHAPVYRSNAEFIAGLMAQSATG